MDTVKAIKLAIMAMETSIQALAVEANLHDMLGADHPAAVKASKKRKRLREAREVLEALGRAQKGYKQ